MFKNPARLEALYEKLLERSIMRFGPKDVLTFLGKKFDGRFSGDQISSMKKRWPGARVKHWMNGNHVAFGFQNRDIRRRLFEQPETQEDSARLSSKTGRLLKKLQVHGLIAKVPRSRRWRVTEKGWATMSASVEIYEVGWMKMTEKKAA